MANLKSERSLRFLGEHFTEKFPLSQGVYPVNIWTGVPMVIDQNVGANEAESGEGKTLTTGDVFLGIAAENKLVQSIHLQRPDEIECYTWPSIVGFLQDLGDAGDYGKAVYFTDTGTLALSSSGMACKIGTFFKEQDGYAFVALTSPLVQ